MDGERLRAPQRVLLTEDQALIAMAIVDEMTDAGFAIVGPFATCADTIAWLRSDTPDFAILDVGLRDGPCTEVALELRRRGVGFAVFSGSLRHEAPPIFAAAPWYEKPSDLSDLIAHLRAGEAPRAA